MGIYAYRDPQKKYLIYASDCTINDVGKHFFCPTHGCKAILSLCSLEGEKKPYFAARRQQKHSAYCTIDTDVFDPSKYDPELFDYTQLMNDLMLDSFLSKGNDTYTANRNKSGSGNVIGINSLAKLYMLCKSMNHNSTYGTMRIRSMLCDDRSNYLYSKILQQKCLIECTYKFYKKETQSIHFSYPLNPELPNQYNVKLIIPDETLFWETTHKIYNRKDLPIVIAGDWKQIAAKNISCKLTSSKQLYYPHPNQ